MKKYIYFVILILIVVGIVIGILIANNGNSLEKKNPNQDTNIRDSISVLRDTITHRMYESDKSDTDSISLKTIVPNIASDSSFINENANEINFSFTDEITGYSVIPESIEIKEKGSGKSKIFISQAQISKNGSVIKHVANGVYDILVTAKGYNPMQAFFNLNDQTININFLLVPINPPEKLSVPYIQSLHQNEAMVIVGSIVDELTGTPLSKVEVYTEDNIVKTYSDENGFFLLIIPLAEEMQQIETRGTIYFKLDKYITEVRENFDMWPDGDYIFKIVMRNGHGLNREKIIKSREVNRVVLPQRQKKSN